MLYSIYYVVILRINAKRHTITYCSLSSVYYLFICLFIYVVKDAFLT